MQKGFSNVLFVIIGVILGLAAIGFFTISTAPHSNTTSSPGVISPPQTDSTSSTNSGQTNPPQTTPSLPPAPVSPPAVVACGIYITSPSINQMIVGTANIAGYIDGKCHWSAFEAQAGTAQIYNSNNQSISAKVPLTVSGNWMQMPAYFTAKLSMTAAPHTPTGYILFTNEDPSGNFPVTYKLPVSF